jgi:O-antigen ligase/tetratricopeptide (TPR) repeat protein
MTKNILKYSILAGLFLVPFIPFLVPSAMFFPFITGKGFAFRLIVEIVFGLFVILAFLDQSYRPRMSWITKSVLLFTAAIFLADILGVNPYKSIWSNYERMEGFVLLLHLAMYYLVTSSVFDSHKWWTRYFNVSIASSVAMSVYGILQLVGKLTINQGGVRVDGTFGNATYLAIYLVFHIFLCLYLLLDSNKPTWQRWAYAAAGLLNLVILYFTATRGAILGLLGGLAIAGLIVAFKEKENVFVRRLAYYSLGFVVVVVIGFISVRNTSFVKNSQVLGRFSTLGISEIKTQGRYFVWPMALKGLKDRPILGWGQENFNFVFNKYYDPRMFGQEQWFDRTHDVVLDWLIAGGIVGFLAYVSMYVALLYYIWRKDSLLKLSEKSVLTGMIAAYTFHNIFVFDNLISYILFFSVLGFVHSMNVKREGVLLQSKYYLKTFSNDTVNYIVLPLVLIVTAGAIYFVSGPAYFANKTLIQAITPQQTGGVEKNLELFKKVYAYNSFGSTEATEQLVQISAQITGAAGVPDNLKQEFYNLARTKVEEKVASTPKDARYLVFAGSFFNHFGQYDEAIKYLERGVTESPKKQTIYFELASSYLGKGNGAKMFELIKQAYDLEPNAPESKILYAVAAIYTKNVAVLNQLDSSIDQDKIINDNRYLKAYADIGDYNSVITILNARILKDPTNVQYKLSLASTYATIGQKQKAIDIIRQIISADPSFKDQGETYIKQIQGN